MYTENDALERLHPKLIALIAHEKRVCGCAMQAVKRVVNEFWVRRVTGRYGKVKIQLHQALNVWREYVRVKKAERRKLKIGHLWPRKADTFRASAKSPVAG
jgi:hypothetical protein